MLLGIPRKHVALGGTIPHFVCFDVGLHNFHVLLVNGEDGTVGLLGAEEGEVCVWRGSGQAVDDGE